MFHSSKLNFKRKLFPTLKGIKNVQYLSKSEYIQISLTLDDAYTSHTTLKGETTPGRPAEL